MIGHNVERGLVFLLDILTIGLTLTDACLDRRPDLAPLTVRCDAQVAMYRQFDSANRATTAYRRFATLELAQIGHDGR